MEQEGQAIHRNARNMEQEEGHTLHPLFSRVPRCQDAMSNDNSRRCRWQQ